MDIGKEAEELKRKLYSENKIKVRIALFGSGGVGKSSIINKIIGKKVAVVGVKTDTTTVEENYEHEGLILADLPGYGTKQFPKETYFEKFDILSFDIFLCIFDGKLSENTVNFFSRLKQNNKVCIFVRNQIDSIYDEDKTLDRLLEDIKLDILKQIKSDKEEIVFVSCKDNYGFDKLQNKIYNLLDEAKKRRWAKNAKAYSDEYLEIKKKIAKTRVLYFAGANGINPIPWVDIKVDVGILLKLFRELRNIYSLSKKKIDLYKHAINPEFLQIANNIIKFGTKEGVLLLLKKYSTRQVVSQISKWIIPFVGVGIAASNGFGITRSAGMDYLNDCHKLAEEILRQELENK